MWNFPSEIQEKSLVFENKKIENFKKYKSLTNFPKNI